MKTDDSVQPCLSVVAPVFNEAKVIAEFVAEVAAALADWPGGYELLCIDDGSNDESVHILNSLRPTHPELRIVRLARNYGQQMALMAGMDFAQGRIVALIDADLQRDPASIPTLLSALDDQTDVVFGVRPARKDVAYRRAVSLAVAWLLRRITGNTIPDATTAFVVMRREFVEALKRHRDHGRVLSYLLLSLSKGRCKAIEVGHRARRDGDSKQRIRAMIGLVISIGLEARWGAPEILWTLAAIHAVIATAGVAVLIAEWNAYVASSAFLAGLAVASTGYLAALICSMFALFSHLLIRVWRETRDVPPYVALEEPGPNEPLR